MARFAVGVDIAKATFVMAAWCGSSVVEVGTFANTPQGFSAARARLQTLQPAYAETLQLVVEPTGGYEWALVAFAYEQGWQVTVVNPKQVREWARGIGQRAKTDAQDACLLARYAAERQPAPQPPLAIEVRELETLLARRSDLEQMLQQERNRLRELAGRPGVAEAIAPNLERVIQALEEALAEVEAAITRHLKGHPRLQRDALRLLSVPGIGPKIVLPLLVLLHRWQTRTAGQGTAKGLTAFVGLDPQPYQSGLTVYRHAAISKMGNRELRRLLYMGALGGVRGHNPLKHFYERLVGRGKAKKLALVAAAHKILLWAWAIFSQQTEWNPHHVTPAS